MLLAISAGSGLAIAGIYHDAPDWVLQAKAQDLISFAVVLPVLIFSAIFGSRGDLWARSIWIGVLAYIVYSYVIAGFDVRFNSLFLIYVALLGCSLYALIGGLISIDREKFTMRFPRSTSTSFTSAFLLLIAASFYVLWLGDVIRALIAGEAPQTVLTDKLPTNPVQVLDMAWILPALAIAAFCLWRRQLIGYVLAGASLTFLTLMGLAILSINVSMNRAGLSVAAPPVIMMIIIVAVSLGFLIWNLKTLRAFRNGRSFQ